MYEINSADTLAALALVPEQIVPYVQAVAPMQLQFTAGFAVYRSAGSAVLVAYPAADDSALADNLAAAHISGEAPQEFVAKLNDAVLSVCGWNGLEQITVLSPVRPGCAPVESAGYTEQRDCYAVLDLPYFKAPQQMANCDASAKQELANNPAAQERAGNEAPACNAAVGYKDEFDAVGRQKLRNVLRRAARDLTVSIESWSDELATLVREYTGSRPLEAGTRHIFNSLAKYSGNDAVRIFVARNHVGALQGFCVGDFTPMLTVFYMFAFRQKHSTPGTADLLLYTLVREAERQGYKRVNLGLGINGGIEFFKHKWGGRDFLPLVESSWFVKNMRGLKLNAACKQESEPVRNSVKKGFFSALFGKKG